jgi:signal transduction histidine kinase/HPt (histidine-containing phosphotransfer) domain-containing protein
MEKKKILIVEDDVVVCENLKENLEGLGYLVSGICTTGEEAVQKAKEIRPDLILMDIKLEGEMDGVEANKEIQRDLNVPVVYLTAYADEKIFPDLKETAPYGVLNKPARIENIRSAIEVALYKFEMEMAQKRANEAALEAKAAAEKANQAKNRFLSHTSHEIRSPTNAIKGFTELLLKTHLTARQEGYVKKIQVSADTLLKLINDILDLSRVEAGKLPIEERDFSIRETIEYVMYSQYLRAKEKDIRVEFFINPNVPEYIKGDPVRVWQIINNLVGNAVKFTKKGYCKVEVNCKQPEGDRFSKDQDKVTIVFSVKDTGIGIPEDKKKTIFESFEQVEYLRTEKFGGAGLGLAISEQLAGRMGGKIEVDSKPGEGSIFTFTADFEIGKEPEQIKYKKLGDAKDKKIGPLKILLADDEEGNQEVITEILRLRTAHDVICVFNGKEAIEKIKKEQFDLILMDVKMPVLDGIEATKFIRNSETNELNSQIPIIAMTGNTSKEDRECYLEVGMNDYISKPIDSNELYSVIQRVVQNRIPYGIQESERDEKELLIIDREGALMRLNGNKKFLNRITVMYRENIPEKIEELKKSLQEENIESSIWFAHSIDEYASQVGALKVSEVASDIEEHMKNKESKLAKDLLPFLQKEHNKAMKKLKSFIQRLKFTR